MFATCNALVDRVSRMGRQYASRRGLLTGFCENAVCDAGVGACPSQGCCRKCRRRCLGRYNLAEPALWWARRVSNG